MVTLTTDIGKLTLKPIVNDDLCEGVEIANDKGETARIFDKSIDEITDKSAVSLFIVYCND